MPHIFAGTVTPVPFASEGLAGNASAVPVLHLVLFPPASPPWKLLHMHVLPVPFLFLQGLALTVQLLWTYNSVPSAAALIPHDCLPEQHGFPVLSAVLLYTVFPASLSLPLPPEDDAVPVSVLQPLHLTVVPVLSTAAFHPVPRLLPVPVPLLPESHIHAPANVRTTAPTLPSAAFLSHLPVPVPPPRLKHSSPAPFSVLLRKHSSHPVFPG